MSAPGTFNILVAALSIALVAPAGAAAAPVEGFASADRAAFAVWFKGGRKPGGYVAVGYQSVNSWSGVETEGGVGKLRCRKKTRRNRTITICRAAPRLRNVGPAGFRMDPLMQTAHLEVAGAKPSVVDWNAETAPEPAAGTGAFSCCGDTYGTAYADGSRLASAQGTVMGKTQSAARSFGVMYETAWGDGYIPISVGGDTGAWVGVYGGVFVVIWVE